MAEQTMIERFWSKVDRQGPNDCWPWIAGLRQSKNKNRYGFFRHGKMRAAHRIAWEISNGRPLIEGMVVRHSCDNSICCNPNHLIEGTQQENVDDRYLRGRAFHHRGSSHSRSKLDESKVKLIRSFLRQGMTTVAVAEHFGVSIYPIYAIKKGKAWLHVRD